MKITRVSYIALSALISVASCSKEAAEPAVIDWADGKILIKPSLSGVASRAQDMTLDRLESFQVTCFNAVDGSEVGKGYLSPYFENATFIKERNLTFSSSPYEEPRNWPEQSGVVTFFAFSPSLSGLGAHRAALERYADAYLLAGIRVDSDISRQVDFVAASVSGRRWNDFAAGVDLAFSHKLSQVELRAWGASNEYDLEIAGVRIGNAVVEGSFVFADNLEPAKTMGWESDGYGVKDKVEYYYGAASLGVALDRIYRINAGEHNSFDSAGSIMGLGGCAMVLPTLNARWEGRDDPTIGNVPYSTDKMYFSVLMRVSNPNSGLQMYPSWGNRSGMAMVSYAVDASGRVIQRLYPGLAEGEYFIDSQLQTPYVDTDGVEIKDFGWAAVPVDADWKAGNKYIYTLDYSEGVGLHDPDDASPGSPILGTSHVLINVEVADWEEGESKDINVPRK